MSRVHANNYSDSLNGAITNVQTTITVNDDTGLPSLSGSDTYNLTISYGEHSEIVTVTDDTSTPTLTVTRGAEGTSARAFYDGSIVELNVTADSLDRKPDKAADETISGDYTFTGALDASGASELLIPTSATPTVNADGEIALDTSVTDWSHSIPKIYGGEELGVVTMPIAEFTSPTDGYVVAYNATNDELELVDSGVMEQGSCSVNLSTNQSISASTVTKIQFDTEEWDTLGDFDSTTNYRYTPSVAGKYLIFVSVAYQSLATGVLTQTFIRKNGSSIAAPSYTAPTGPVVVTATTYASTTMNGSTDYIEAFVFHNDSVSRNIGGGSGQTIMFVYKVED